MKRVSLQQEPLCETHQKNKLVDHRWVDFVFKSPKQNISFVFILILLNFLLIIILLYRNINWNLLFEPHSCNLQIHCISISLADGIVQQTNKLSLTAQFFIFISFENIGEATIIRVLNIGEDRWHFGWMWLKMEFKV